MAWCTTSATSSYSLVVFLVLVGLILGSTSEPIEPQREPWLGSLDCPPSLTVQWNEILVRPPYVVKEIQYPTDDFDSTKQNSTDDFDSTKQNSTYDFDGLFPTILEMMLNECCRLSSNVVYLNSSDAEPDFNLPVIVNLEAVKYNINRQRNLTLVSLLPQTGTAFVVVKANKSDQLWQVMKSLFSTWPVLVLTLILSLLAGIIAWSLETRKNPDSFPSMFTKGTWEGFWWAFISMTTVGYGDCYPKSVGGRLFAIMWILVGMCIISIFTAALTSSLTALSLETKVNLPGAKVVALLGSIDSITGFQHQADLTRVQTPREIHEKLESGEFQGALMDAYFLSHYKINYPTSNLRVQEVIQHKHLEYGVRVKDIKLADCFREKRYTQEADLYEHAEIYLQQSLSSNFENEDDNQVNFFDPEGLLYFPVFYVCFGVTAFLMMAGGAWDLYHNVNCLFIKTGQRSRKDLSLLLSRKTCDISQEKLQDLENKIQDLSQTFDVIKNGIISANGRYSKGFAGASTERPGNHV